MASLGISGQLQCPRHHPNQSRVRSHFPCLGQIKRRLHFTLLGNWMQFCSLSLADFLLCTVFLLLDWMTCKLMDPATHRKSPMSQMSRTFLILSANSRNKSKPVAGQGWVQ